MYFSVVRLYHKAYVERVLVDKLRNSFDPDNISVDLIVRSYEYTSTYHGIWVSFTVVEVCCKKQYVPDVPLLVNLCDFVALCEKIHRKVSGWSHSQVVFVVHCVASERAATNVQGEGHGVIRSNAGY